MRFYKDEIEYEQDMFSRTLKRRVLVDYYIGVDLAVEEKKQPIGFSIKPNVK